MTPVTGKNGLLTAPALRRWGLVLLGLFALVLVPFALLAGTLESWSAAVLRSQGATLMAAAAGGALLSADIVLPIPSSLVLTTLGAILGAVPGTLVGAAGLTCGCAIGYSLGRISSRAGQQWLGATGDDSIGPLLGRYGLAVVVACRAVPVLAEASIVAAGIGRIPPLRCLGAASLANVGMAAVYAGVGSRAAEASMFGAAFAASIAIPGLTLAIATGLKRRFDAA
jgi:uncharacterized membrane protein YdjX (TVP38/TMEM64 family)